MSSYIRVNQFISAANQIYSSHTRQCLMADAQGLSVHPQPLTHAVAANVREENKRTWKVFKEGLIGTIGQQKFDWICQRYRSRLNFSALENSGRPLLPAHVELFSTGSFQLLGRDIKARFPGKLKTMTREQMKDSIRSVQPFSVVGSFKDPVKITGSPSVFSAFFVHDKFLMDKEKQVLFSDVEALSFPAWLERFSKVTINRELLEGQIIPAPGQDGRIDYYKVVRKISTGDGLIAYALKPAVSNSTLKPILCFRPSQWAIANEDAFQTYLNDVQPHVGAMGWTPSIRQFELLMQNPHFRRNNEKITIAGYSLGGAHAQRFLEEHSENVAHAIFYNDPSVDNATAERFATKVNSMPRRTEPLNIQIFRMKGDPCSYVGDKHVGWGVTHPDVNIQLMESDHENKQVFAFNLHSHRIFDNTTFPYQVQRFERHENPQELFQQLDNTQRGPDVLWYERMRSLSGGVAFVVFRALFEMVKFVSGLLGVRLLRSSRDPN
jgi:hypothetical protein